MTVVGELHFVPAQDPAGTAAPVPRRLVAAARSAASATADAFGAELLPDRSVGAPQSRLAIRFPDRHSFDATYVEAALHVVLDSVRRATADLCACGDRWMTCVRDDRRAG